ncbi:hypothetical protein E3O44_09185 [Cryobacterium algoricola]|uniref:Uncharacterized protein n=1 Tax=Cryobacterium algoricola TaxID=1259183 RepID=A0ABY2IG08_9MICO|nr:hypothetical protein [Cryobacterium algoricola]TFB87285.1 hypothetical protein E3O44_09185 [Cryobacterium algoricola]
MSVALLEGLRTSMSRAAEVMRADPRFGSGEAVLQSDVVSDALSGGTAQYSARGQILADVASDVASFPATAAHELQAADARLASGTMF